MIDFLVFIGSSLFLGFVIVISLMIGGALYAIIKNTQIDKEDKK